MRECREREVLQEGNVDKKLYIYKANIHKNIYICLYNVYVYMNIYIPLNAISESTSSEAISLACASQAYTLMDMHGFLPRFVSVIR